MDSSQALARRLAELERRLSAVERGSRLGRSSFESGAGTVWVGESLGSGPQIADEQISLTAVWSSAKTADALASKADMSHSHPSPFPPGGARAVASVFGTSGGTVVDLARADFAAMPRGRALMVAYFGWSASGQASGVDDVVLRVGSSDSPVVSGVSASNQGSTGTVPRTFVAPVEVPDRTAFSVVVRGTAVTNNRTGRDLTVLIYPEA